MKREEYPAYIGRKTCGCVVFAMVDDPEHKKETAKEIAKCIRQGLTIERMTVKEVRELEMFGCKHEKE